jgi:hypothetical protein
MTEFKSSGNKPLISIVYHSGGGHTAEMSHAVAKGVLSAGDVSVLEHPILDENFTGGRWLTEPLCTESAEVPWGLKAQVNSIAS